MRFDFDKEERKGAGVSSKDGMELQDVGGKGGVECVRVCSLAKGCNKVKGGLGVA
jgi:hypothetical protein